MLVYTYLSYQYDASLFIGFWAAHSEAGGFVGESVCVPGRPHLMADYMRVAFVPAFNFLVHRVRAGDYHQIISTSARLIANLGGDFGQVPLFPPAVPTWVRTVFSHPYLHNAIRPSYRAYKAYPSLLRDNHDLFVDRVLRRAPTSLYTRVYLALWYTSPRPRERRSDEPFTLR